MTMESRRGGKDAGLGAMTGLVIGDSLSVAGAIAAGGGVVTVIAAGLLTGW